MLWKQRKDEAIWLPMDDADDVREDAAAAAAAAG